MLWLKAAPQAGGESRAWTWHILTSGCFSLETSSFSNEKFQQNIIYAFCIFESISIDSKMLKRAVSSMATHT